MVAHRHAPHLMLTRYERRYLATIRELLFHTPFAHTHLDWYETDYWLDTTSHETRLAWMGGRLVGMLGFAAPMHGYAWLRLAMVHQDYNPFEVMPALWRDVQNGLRVRGARYLALLVVEPWIIAHANAMGMHYQEDVVTLQRFSWKPPPTPEPMLVIRAAEVSEVATLSALDEAAFEPPWQMTPGEVRQAYRLSSTCTVAVVGNEILGYQMSNLFFDGAHLARLAVAPRGQGKGIGLALATESLQRSLRRGVPTMTVNTQASNVRALHLYEGLGFERNGYDLPYWVGSLE